MQQTFIRFLITVSIFLLGLAACGTSTNGGPTGDTGDASSDHDDGEQEEAIYESPILTYFLEADDDHITLNISEAREDYLIEEQGEDFVDDMRYTLQVERSEDLDIIDSDRESLSVDEMYEGDKVYIDYDIEDYIDDEDAVVETEQLIVEDITPEDMLERFAPEEEDEYYVGFVHRDDEIWDDYDQEDLEVLLEYESVPSYGSILHQDDVPAYDYVEAFDIEDDLPVFFIISQEGLAYQTDELAEVEKYLQESEG